MNERLAAKLALIRKEASMLIGVENACSCVRCGRVLKDPISIQRKIGPECLKKEEAENTEGEELDNEEA